MLRPLVLRIHLRPGQRVRRIQVVERLRRDQREVRRDHADIEHPRTVAVLRCFLAQPLARGGDDVAVVAGVVGFARAGLGTELHRADALRQLVADQAEQVADAVDDMHRQDLFIEAVAARIGVLIVQLADRHGMVAGRHRAMAPARRRALVGDRVVPAAVLVHMAAGGEAGAARHADRAVGIGARESGAAGREAVQVGRLDDRMAGVSGDLRIVFV